MHEIIASELSASNMTDGEVLLNLFKQTRRKINEISASWCLQHETMLLNRLYQTSGSIHPIKNRSNFLKMKSSA
ncbi:Mobile element protein [Candidatus Enterovibrio altilux]|uniref:Mobile element protein n=1 Tax=Candidatus Enterovibrio altilux TaxID=1927128 RepID=A0A291BAJ5_9GAMM|nr:Mobile element protein [Candidatus Enterovibrio luxaltus]